MRRFRYHEYGGPEVLKLEEADAPEPGPGQVRIRAEVIGANYVDTQLRRGPFLGIERELPGKLTGDVVGTVDAVGPGTDPALAGRRVAALVAEDAFADQVVADADWLAPVPDGLDEGAASMLPMGAPVALGVARTGRINAGDTVLVTAAAGGIGHLAVQFAKLLGAGTVIAAAGSRAKLDFARDHGADAAVDYTDPDWPDQVRATAPGGVDVLLDPVGGDVLLRGIQLLAPLGRAVVYGAASGQTPGIPFTSLFGMQSVTGFSLLAWRGADPDRARRDMAEVAGHFVAGRLRTTVHARLPLTEAAAAHRLLEDRAHLGRVLLVP